MENRIKRIAMCIVGIIAELALYLYLWGIAAEQVSAASSASVTVGIGMFLAMFLGAVWSGIFWVKKLSVK